MMGNTSEQKTTGDGGNADFAVGAKQRRRQADDAGSSSAVAESPGCTQLMYACQQGDVEQVKKILKSNRSLARDRDRTLKTALHYCADTRTAQCADLVLRAAPDLVNAADEDGLTPLHLAVISGNLPFVNFLLANGANPHVLDNEKHSVVHWATVCGETAALRSVLAAHAPVCTPDVHGGYPLHYAAQMCGAKDTTLDGKEYSSSRDVSKLGLEVLDTLLSSSGIKVDAKDGDGRQPLLWAASAGSAAAVLALVAAGAAPEAADKDGLTALHCAASRGHTDCLEALLMMCGVTPDIIDSNGCTALHYAVTLGHADATALLLAHGAEVNRQDRKGRTPAHCGCAKGQVETVRMLGEHGADLWLRSARGDLPLHEAAASGRRQLVRWLLAQRPANVNAANNDGRTPLHVAALNDNADLCKILLDHGAEVNAILTTSKNVLMTPLDCALKRGFRSTAKYLQLNGGVPFNRLRTQPNQPARSTGLNVEMRSDIVIRSKRGTDKYQVGDSDSASDTECPVRKHKKKIYKHKRKIQITKDSYAQYEKIQAEGSDSSISINRASVSPPAANKDSVKTTETIQKNSDPTKAATKSRLKSDKDKSEEAKAETKRRRSSLIRTKSQIKSDDSDKRKSDVSVVERKNGLNKSESKSKTKNKELSPDKIVTKAVEDVNKVQKNEKTEEIDKSAETKDRQKVNDKEITKQETKSLTDSNESLQQVHVAAVTEALVHVAQNGRQEQQEEQPSATDKIKQNGENDTTANGAIESDVNNKEKIIKKQSTLVKSEDSFIVIGENNSETESFLVIDGTNIASKDAIEKQDKNSSEIEIADSAQTEKVAQRENDSVDEKSDEMTKETKSLEEDGGAEKCEQKDDKKDSEEITLEKNEEKLSVGDEAADKKNDETTEVKNDQDEEKMRDTVDVETIEGKNGELTVEKTSQEIVSANDGENTIKDVENEDETVPSQKEKADGELIVDNEDAEKEINVSEVGETKDAETKEAVESGSTDQKVSDEKGIIQERSEENKKDEIATRDNIEPTENENTEPPPKNSSVEADQTMMESSGIELKDKIPEEMTISGEIVYTETNEKLNSQPNAKEFESFEILSKTEDQIKNTLNQSDDRIGDVKIVEREKPKQRKKKHASRTEASSKHKLKSDKTGSRSASDSSSDGSDRSSGRGTDLETEPKPAVVFESVNADSADVRVSNEVDADQKSDEKIVDLKNEEKLNFPDTPDIPLLDKDEISLSEFISGTQTPVDNFLQDGISNQTPLEKEKLKLPKRRPNKYSDEESDESDQDISAKSASRKRRVRTRSKSGKESYGSDSQLMDSGFEPSPRSSRIPKRKCVTKQQVNMTSVTQNVQSSIHRYHLERKIFQHLLELKRLQIRSGQANEAVLVKRAIDAYHRSILSTVGAGRYTESELTFKRFEQFLYDSLRKLQKGKVKHLEKLPEAPAGQCTHSTLQCPHATHAYTGIPCAAYITKLNHHTIPKVGFGTRPGGFLPNLRPDKSERPSTQGSVTLELCHGRDRQLITLPAERLDHNKKYYVTFTVKGQSETDNEMPDQQGHRHAKSC